VLSAGKYFLNGSLNRYENEAVSYRKAVEWYRKFAQRGHIGAQVELEVLIESKERGFDAEDEAKFRAAAAAGAKTKAENAAATVVGNSSASDMFKIAESDLAAGRYVQAAIIFRKLAESGHAKAQTRLAFCLENGRGVMKNKTESLRWYCKAAEQGEAEAQNNLGSIYEVGDGVKQDISTAFNWYRKAAIQGYAPAQYIVGSCYSAGRGVARDKTEAVKWYRRAAEQGYEAAIDTLANG
jgi:TPR repeat protein